jgi:hypothetical protein
MPLRALRTWRKWPRTRSSDASRSPTRVPPGAFPRHAVACEPVRRPARRVAAEPLAPCSRRHCALVPVGARS